jgi:hypothetical protein
MWMTNSLNTWRLPWWCLLFVVHMRQHSCHISGKAIWCHEHVWKSIRYPALRSTRGTWREQANHELYIFAPHSWRLKRKSTACVGASQWTAPFSFWRQMVSQKTCWYVHTQRVAYGFLGCCNACHWLKTKSASHGMYLVLWFLFLLKMVTADKTIKLWRVQDRKRPVAIVDSYSDKVCVYESLWPMCICRLVYLSAYIYIYI